MTSVKHTLLAFHCVARVPLITGVYPLLRYSYYAFAVCRYCGFMKEHQAKSQQAPTGWDSLDLQTNSNNV